MISQGSFTVVHEQLAPRLQRRMLLRGDLLLLIM